jgi:superfamily II DNA or RNA helicase
VRDIFNNKEYIKNMIINKFDNLIKNPDLDIKKYNNNNNNILKSYESNRKRIVFLDKPKLITKLRKHQEEALDFAINLENESTGGCFFHEMGMGKTLIILSLYLKTYDINNNKNKMLVVCPKQAIFEWKEEISKHSRGIKVLGYKKINKSIKNIDIVIVNYDRLVAEYNKHKINKDSPIFNGNWYRVILDESHNIKNINTERWRAVSNLMDISKKRWISTGTPIHNRIKEIYTSFLFIDAPDLGSWDDWRTSREEILFQKTKEILSKVAIRKLCGSDLPPLLEFKYSMSFCSEEEKILYDEIYNNIVKFINIYDQNKENLNIKFHIKNNILSNLIQLREVCVLPSLVLKKNYDNNNNYNNKYYRKKYKSLIKEGVSQISDPTISSNLDLKISKKSFNIEINKNNKEENNKYWSNINCTKMKMLESFINEKIKPNDKILIYSNFLGVLDQIEIKLDFMNFKYVRLDGKMSQKEREKSIKSFKINKTIKFFLLSIGAGNSSLNLQEANRIIIMDTSYNPQIENQAKKRSHRIGQKRKVIVTYFTIANSIEEKIRERSKSKEIVSDCVLSNSKNLKDAKDGFNGIKKSLLTSKKVSTLMSMNGIREVINNTLSLPLQHKNIFIDEEHDFIEKNLLINDMKNLINIKIEQSNNKLGIKRVREDNENENENENEKIRINNKNEIIILNTNKEYISIKNKILKSEYIVKGTKFYGYDWISSNCSDISGSKIYITFSEAFLSLLDNLSISKKRYKSKLNYVRSELNKELIKKTQELKKIDLLLNNDDIIKNKIILKESIERKNYINDICDIINYKLENPKKFFQNLSCIIFEIIINQDIKLNEDMKYIPIDIEFVDFENYAIPEDYFNEPIQIPIDNSITKLWLKNNYFDRFIIDDNYIKLFYDNSNISECLSLLPSNPENLNKSILLSEYNNNILIQIWENSKEIFITCLELENKPININDLTLTLKNNYNIITNNYNIFHNLID